MRPASLILKLLPMLVPLALAFVLAGCGKDHFQPVEQQPIIASANVKDHSLTFLDPSRNKVSATWQLDFPLSGALFLGLDQLLVYGKQADKALIYQLSTGKQIKTWNVGKGVANALLSHSKQLVYVVDQHHKSIRAFRLDGTLEYEVPVGKQPLHMYEAKDGSRLYVINFDDTTMSIIDTKSHKVVQTFGINESSAGGLLLDDRRELWVGGHGTGAEVESDIHVYNMDTGSLIRRIPAPYMPVSFAQTNTGIFALSHGSNTLRKFDRSAGAELGTLKIGANPFEMKAIGSYLYVASYDSNEIYIIDPESLTVSSIIPVGQGPFQILSNSNS
ncbi:YncE family protein [Paenibacillus alvei]|uniref:YncE family protein n=1 Tax=Paenibacillus alvei TaxID=44250 RepID=UPI0013D98A9A|nr:YncE family protein [Paenibacillus alvei]NEZ40078.1 hypothetical protein [Paenibacillus alvei]